MLQYFEYLESGFTISDGVFGTVFYASTGLHGLKLEAPTKNINSYFKSINYIKFRKLNSNSYSLDRNFLEWLAGFTDAEGNFNISLRNFKDNKYNSLIITYQIGLHIDDLFLLKLIQKKLNCGHISISGKRCNYFVNDRESLINVILPIFNYAKLNSSKYFQFLIFEKAINLIKNKYHLTEEGKLEIIKYFHEIKIVNKTSTSKNKSDIIISDYWLGGFTDGDGCFSSSKYYPKLKFENHIKELELFESIKEFFNSGNLTILKARKNIKNGYATNSMVVLEFNNIHNLKNVIIPFYKNNGYATNFSGWLRQSILKSKKYLDFCDWSILVNICYYGYHKLPLGIDLFCQIKERMNNFRLSSNINNSITNSIYKNQLSVPKAEIKHPIFYFPTSLECSIQGNNNNNNNNSNNNNNHNHNHILFKDNEALGEDSSLLNATAKVEVVKSVEILPIDLESKLSSLYTLPSPYEIKNGVRYLRNTNKLVSEK